MVQKLNDCGIVPILATFSMMERSIDHGIDPTNPCVMWEDDLLKHLDGLQWARFYEQVRSGSIASRVRKWLAGLNSKRRR